MQSLRTRYTALAVIIALLIASQLASGAPADKPAKTQYLGTFNGAELWKPFGLLSVEEPTTKTAKSVPLLQLTDAAGKAVAVAQWDGEGVVLSKDGREWTITVTTTVGFKKLSYSLKSVWSDKTKLSWGLADLSLTYIGDAADVAKYRHVLRLPGSGSWVSKDGKSGAIASIEGFSGNLASYMAVVPVDGSCTFKSKQIAKSDSNKNEKKIFFVEATSTAPKAGEAPKAQVMGIRLTEVKAWSYEPVVDLATAIVTGTSDPDVRIFGTADKPAASPGESLEYTYYLFNAGMDEATDLVVTLPVSDKTSLISDSIYGSPGRAKLLPSGDEEEVTADKGQSSAVDGGTKSIQWKPNKNLMPGETMFISFSVII